jgi:hypothetical protein
LRLPDGVKGVIVWTLGGVRVTFGRFPRKVTRVGSYGPTEPTGGKKAKK